MKSYAKPELITHGNVEEITLNTGRNSDVDFIIITGLPAGFPDQSSPSDAGGSIDQIIDLGLDSPV